MRKRRYEVKNDSVTVARGGAPERVGKPGRPRGESQRSLAVESGRHDTSPKGSTRRPTGKSSARDTTSIDPENPIDPRSPNLR